MQDIEPQVTAISTLANCLMFSVVALFSLVLSLATLLASNTLASRAAIAAMSAVLVLQAVLFRVRISQITEQLQQRENDQ